MKQNYNTELMFAVRTFIFHAPIKLTNDTLAICRTLEYKEYNEPQGVGTSMDIHKDPRFNSIHEWMQMCVDTLHGDNGWECDRIIVNKSWANRSDAQSGHHHGEHRHSMSYLSGILYLNGFNESPTVFHDPIDKRRWSQFHLDGGPNIDYFFLSSRTPAGTLIIFPSWLVHSSTPNNATEDRFTIAFNTFPTGDINSGGWEQPMAKIKVE